jgi:hypothetical protein
MADNFLEYHHDEYEKRKAKWLAKKQNNKLIYRNNYKD